ncbi:MBL fold metallo-hydrolase [Amycolatopsis sp. A133]|uniref:MBL fold metallo-hydrolase n=1 Tax=Amycolatopsis sp. A133 TaxID=3064472 RepID=UPI0027EB91AF|nr:MBL fold metallo-hydrolase [Amycolatopsis sp. A133]MDQ7808920.1 MBL fold metallo-hydrolase [Amycolatopsis sp. A133]
MTEIKLGDVTVTRVEEQHGPVMPARGFFPDPPERAWREHRPAVPAWDHLRLDHPDRLREAGVRPEDVDLVVHTHLHPDHIGWNTRLVDGTWVPTFPRATHLMPRGLGRRRNRPAGARPLRRPQRAGGRASRRLVRRQAVGPVPPPVTPG